jgi:hypothetical protein
MGTALMDCGHGADELRTLESPERNRYYYGKLLDAYHLELEQRYGNHKRWLINRLTLGSGVLCGLDVVRTGNGTMVAVMPGVAVDGVGREIIVPRESREIDSRQPTDECGNAEGIPIRGAGNATVYLCYHECETDPARVLVSRCGPEAECENGMVRERYRVRIREGEPPMPGSISPDTCAQIFAEPPAGTTRRSLICQLLGGTCDPPDEICVPLAVVRLNEQGIASIERCTFRRTIYSNAVLLDLILCLAARVDECCGTLSVKSLIMVSGDQQVGVVNQPLPNPLVVRVVDGGSPVDNETVTFDVVPGSGEIGPNAGSLGPSFVTHTAASGLATLPMWKLGPNAGEHRVTARIADGTPSMVTFRAKVEPVVLDLPVVRAIWPTNAVSLNRRSADPVIRDWFDRWLRSPRIEITFNHKMLDLHLQKPDAWLRAFIVRRFGRAQRVAVRITPLRIAYAGPAPLPILPFSGFTEVYALRGLEDGLPPRGPNSEEALEVRFLVQMRADGNNIVDTATPPQLLDAEFRGTLLDQPTPLALEEIWAQTTEKTYGSQVWTQLADTGQQLPQSGNGSEGGWFHSWFEVVRVD